MKKYGKIVCGALRVPQNYPNAIVLDGQTINNPSEEHYKEAGYLPINESEPNAPEGKVAVAHYALNKKGTAIVQTWTYEDAPEMVQPDETEAEVEIETETETESED